MLDLSKIDLTPRPVVPGYRHFECDCGLDWVQWSRDCDTPSGEPCPECGDWTLAHRASDEAIERHVGPIAKGK